MEGKQKSAEKLLHKRKRKKRIRRILLGFMLLVISFMLFGAAYVLGIDAWHEFEPNKILKAPQTLIIYDNVGNEVSTLHGGEDRIYVSLSEIPEHVKNAFISAEDARFYEHNGIDIIRILGAAWADIKAGGYVQGASTISQQLVKLSHLTADKNITRKLEEAVLAYQMEKEFDKDEILEMYLNYVYFGRGYYGVEAAARGYFGVHVSELTVAQGAQLAGILKAPANYAPHLDVEASLGRRNLILDLMEEYGYLDETQKSQAKQEKPVLLERDMEEKRGYYIDLALQQACEVLAIDMDTLLNSGYRIHTAMDTEIQVYCEEVMKDDSLFPTTEREGESVQAALVIVDAQSGGIVALMGGRESTAALEYNRAVRIRRQPGSVIKPIIAYAPALEQYGYTTVSMLLDTPTDFDGYQPKNYGDQYYGWVTMRDAVAKSLNVPAVMVLNTIGVDTGKQFAESVGISFDDQDRGLTLALGGFTYGVSPYQLAGAYASFAAGGVYSTPSLITNITTATGEVLYQYEPERRRVMSEENSYILTSMLESAIKEGTGKRLNTLDMELAGKTGTTGTDNGNRDAWMAVYNPEYAAVVWMGYDNAAEGQALPANVTGGTYPAEILKKIYSKIYENRESPTFTMPSGVREYRLDKYTLQNQHTAVLANGLTPTTEVVREVFLVGTEPSDYSEYWSIPAPPSQLAITATELGYPKVEFYPENSMILYQLYRENESGESTLVGEWPGNEGFITYIDKTVPKQGTYYYYVLPVHPQLTIGGKQVVGPVSRRLEVMANPSPFIFDDDKTA